GRGARRDAAPPERARRGIVAPFGALGRLSPVRARGASDMTYSRIVGTGGYLPEKILTNQDLERMVDTSDEWIRTRTGIAERRIAADGQTAGDLAFNASRA